MAYIIAILLSLTLLGAFLALTHYETTHGIRFFGTLRGRFDKRVARITFIMSHVDWSAFLSHFTRSLAARIVHDIAHTSLIVVRILERVLTRIVKSLRTRRQSPEIVTEEKRFDLRASLAQFRTTLERKDQALHQKDEA
ncbi:MAG TPA: hypothetical protein VNU47_00260 [Candidatus Paceibacterota bacterium]|nr:hypothetical protein [Candidatus Paceibacterota bacterium]